MSNLEDFINNKSEIDLGDSNNVKLIGEGTLGSTYYMNKNNYSFAIKCINNDKFSKELSLE